jgi:hypothetical protein
VQAPAIFNPGVVPDFFDFDPDALQDISDILNGLDWGFFFEFFVNILHGSLLNDYFGKNPENPQLKIFGIRGFGLSFPDAYQNLFAGDQLPQDGQNGCFGGFS